MPISLVIIRGHFSTHALLSRSITTRNESIGVRWCLINTVGRFYWLVLRKQWQIQLYTAMGLFFEILKFFLGALDFRKTHIFLITFSKNVLASFNICIVFSFFVTCLPSRAFPVLLPMPPLPATIFTFSPSSHFVKLFDHHIKLHQRIIAKLCDVIALDIVLKLSGNIFVYCTYVHDLGVFAQCMSFLAVNSFWFGL